MTDKYDKLAKELVIDWKKVNYDQFCMGMEVEQEHKDITKGNDLMTAKIVMAHLKEIPDYYTRLKRMEDMAEMEMKDKNSDMGMTVLRKKSK